MDHASGCTECCCACVGVVDGTKLEPLGICNKYGMR